MMLSSCSIDHTNLLLKFLQHQVNNLSCTFDNSIILCTNQTYKCKYMISRRYTAIKVTSKINKNESIKEERDVSKRANVKNNVQALAMKALRASYFLVNQRRSSICKDHTALNA